MNEVIRILESGRGKIIGKVMLYPVEDRALFQVKVLGLAVADRDSVQVRIRPLHGAGAIVVKPGEMVDNTAAARAKYDRKMKATRFYEDLPLGSTRMLQSAAGELIGDLTRKQYAIFDKIAPKTAAGTIVSHKSASGYELKRIVKAAVAAKFGTNEEEID